MTAAAASSPARAGNDVVDTGPGSAEPSQRFLARVCAPAELLALGRARDRQLAWALFAAKEAAFKAHVKRCPQALFSPRSFVVAEDLDAVFHVVEQFRLELEFGDQWVHALAYTGGTKPHFSVGEISSNETEGQAARHLLCELAARTLGHSGSGLEVVRHAEPRAWSGRGPPFLSAGGHRVPCDISLSHDGRFAACAVLEWS